MATTKKAWTDYQVGQDVCYVSKRGRTEVLTISFVGRKWCRFKNQREDWRVQKGETLVEAKGYGPIGYLYESLESYDKIRSENLEKLSLKEKIRNFDLNLTKASIDDLKEIVAIIDRIQK